MFWFEDPDSVANIWVLSAPAPNFLSGATWQRHVDDWPKQEEYSCDAARANGAAGPVRGFGWLWCNNLEIRQRVGNPVGPEAGSGDDPPFACGQFFEGGAIFYKPRRQDPLNTKNQGIVLFTGEGWRRFDLP
jgi:hypothetical protein